MGVDAEWLLRFMLLLCSLCCACKGFVSMGRESRVGDDALKVAGTFNLRSQSPLSHKHIGILCLPMYIGHPASAL